MTLRKNVKYIYIDTEGLTERCLTEQEFEQGIVNKPGDWDYKADILKGNGFAIDIKTCEKIVSVNGKTLERCSID